MPTTIIIPLLSGLHWRTVKIIKQTKQYGLSLGDRGCIALAMFKNYPILTCDKIWQKIDLDVEFIMAR